MGKLNFPEPLSEKYRPRTIDGFIGLHKARRVLESFASRPYSSAWIFLGESGIGKTTIAMALAAEIKAEVHLIPSRKCDLEEVERVCSFCHYIPLSGGFHLVICDEADQMTNAAQLTFLSKLDATATVPNTIFIFTANSVKLLEQRFQSRCRLLEFKNETLEGELEHYLRRIYKKEKGAYRIDFAAIAKASNFNVRDALNKLEVELMMGSDRSDLPAEKEMSPVEAHMHNCPKCHKSWRHEDPMCEIAYRSACPACGGAMTVGSARALKAYETMRKNRQAEIEAAAKELAKKRKRNKAA